MQPGDVLLMVTKASFLEQHRNQDLFALVSQVSLHRAIHTTAG